MSGPDIDLDPPFCRRALLMDANDGTVDHLHVALVRRDDGVHETVPHARLSPPIEAIVDRRRRPVALGQVGPGRAGPQHPKNAVQHTTVVHARNPAWFIGKMRSDRPPLEVRQIVAAHRQAPVWELESRPNQLGNPHGRLWVYVLDRCGPRGDRLSNASACAVASAPSQMIGGSASLPLPPIFRCSSGAVAR